MYACMHACMYVCMLCMYVCMYVCNVFMYVMYVCMSVCMYACMYVCMRFGFKMKCQILFANGLAKRGASVLRPFTYHYMLATICIHVHVILAIHSMSSWSVSFQGRINSFRSTAIQTCWVSFTTVWKHTEYLDKKTNREPPNNI